MTYEQKLERAVRKWAEAQQEKQEWLYAYHQEHSPGATIVTLAQLRDISPDKLTWS